MDNHVLLTYVLTIHFCYNTDITLALHNSVNTKDIQVPKNCVSGNVTVMSFICTWDRSEVDENLRLLPPNTEQFQIVLDTNQQDGPQVPAIDLRGISHLKDIKFLEIASKYPRNTYGLVFDETTFENLTKVKELSINVVTYNRQLDRITQHIKCLEVLNLSGTTKLSTDVMIRVMASLNKSCLRKLLLSGYQLAGVTQHSGSLNISQFFSADNPLPLEYLDLSRNMLSVIFPSIIDMLPNLTYLDISYNNILSWTNNPLIVEIVLHPKLEIVHMENQGSGHFSMWGKYLFESQLNKQKFQTLSSGLQSIPPYMLDCIKRHSNGNLTNLFKDSLKFCHTFKCLGETSDHHLLTGVSCRSFEKLEDVYSSSCPLYMRFNLLTNMKQLTADNLNWVVNPLSAVPPNICINDLGMKVLSFAENSNWLQNTFLYDAVKIINFTSLTKNLEELYLSNNNLGSIPQGNLTSLRKLNLTGNHIHLNGTKICEKFPNLMHLSLASNNLSYLDEDFFSSCKNLTDLDLSQNSFNLTQYHLSVVQNKALQKLNLNKNKLNFLPDYFTQQLEVITRYQTLQDAESKLQLVFGDNNLLCQCSSEIIKFITWFQSTTVDIPGKYSYSCSTYKGQQFLVGIDIDEFKGMCFLSSKVLIIESVFATIAVICCIFLIGALYRYRWKLQYRLVWSSTYLCWCKQNKQPIPFNDNEGETIKYDAFVSYCAEDRFWVHDCLMKTLEGDQYGLKLCIHYRDFPVGDDISSVIVQSIRQSRKLIIVLSECSIGRPWCQFEFQVALSEAVRRNIKLAVIKLGQFSVEEVHDTSVAWVLDNHTYLEWHENKNAQKVFWFKLLRHLYGDTSGTCCLFGSRGLASDDVAAYAEYTYDTPV